MAAGLKDVITQLEQQKDAIERALSALREVEGVAAEIPTPVRPVASGGTKATRKGGMSPEGKQRLIAALKKRWAAKKAAEAAPAATKKTSAKRTRRTKAAA